MRTLTVLVATAMLSVSAPAATMAQQDSDARHITRQSQRERGAVRRFGNGQRGRREARDDRHGESEARGRVGRRHRTPSRHRVGRRTRVHRTHHGHDDHHDGHGYGDDHYDRHEHHGGHGLLGGLIYGLTTHHYYDRHRHYGYGYGHAPYYGYGHSPYYSYRGHRYYYGRRHLYYRYYRTSHGHRRPRYEHGYRRYDGFEPILFEGVYYDDGYRLNRGRLHREELAEILGYEALDYISHEILGLDSFYAERLTGRWYDPAYDSYGPPAYYEYGYQGEEYEDGLALQLFLDGERVGELTDFDHDRAVDLVLIRR